MPNTFPLLAVRGIEKTTPAFREQLVAGALAYGLNPSYVAAVIAFESGFNPAARNPDGGALGLIQWRRSIFPAVAKKAGMKIEWEDLPRLTAEEQLPLVFAYYADKPIRETSNASDYYLAVFLPIGVGKTQDFVLGEWNSTETHPGGLSLGKVYELNKGLDKNPQNGMITVAKAAAPVLSILQAARGRTPLPVPLDLGSPSGYRGSLRSTLPSPGGVYSSPLPRPAPLPSTSADTTSGDTEDDDRDTLPTPREGTHDLPTLREGDHGTLVCLLQRLLDVTSSSDNPDYQVVVDGEFGRETKLAVELHQRRVKEMMKHEAFLLSVDGVCGPRTWSSFWQPWIWSLDRISNARHPSEPPIPRGQ